jgi:hypothetical protein
MSGTLTSESFFVSYWRGGSGDIESNWIDGITFDATDTSVAFVSWEYGLQANANVEPSIQWNGTYYPLGGGGTLTGSASFNSCNCSPG